MRPLTTKSDLLALIAQHAPTKACQRAATEGRATVLGGFIPAEYPCFIVTVRAERLQAWTIRVDVDEVGRRYTVQLISESEIPWEHWDGRRNGKRLIDGDTPAVCAFKRMKARASKYPRLAK